MDKHPFKILIPAFLLIGTLAGATVLASGKNQNPVPSFAAPVTLPAPKKPVNPTPEPTVISQVSPDGKMTLTLRQIKGNGTTTWKFEIDGNELFSDTLPTGSEYVIPYNTFSPDDKYIFLKKTDSGMVSYPVLATSGNSAIPEIAGLFSTKLPDYKITDVTGWGGMNLIVINTDKASGGTGPSFWYDVPSHSFIRLTNRFN